VTSSDKLLFLISQPRAGSTLLQRILAGHPEVHTTAEPWLMLHPVYALRDAGHDADYNAALAYKALHDFLGSLDGGREHYFEALRRMALYLYGTACEQAGKSYFLDKTPRYFLIIPELAAIFQRAHFVILLRNPLAVLASILNTWVGGDWMRLSRHYDNLLVAPRLLLEGIQLLGTQATVVHYEDLVREPADQVAALCARLGLDYYSDMLEYGKRPAPAGRYGDPAGVQQHVRPTTATLDRWLQLGQVRQTRHFGQEYLAALGPELLAGLGYDYADLEAKLNAVACPRRGIIIPWQRVFAPKKTFWNQLSLITIELLQQGRLPHSSKQVAKLLTGRL
jgi:hypothetical protein